MNKKEDFIKTLHQALFEREYAIEHNLPTDKDLDGDYVNIVTASSYLAYYAGYCQHIKDLTLENK